MYDNEPFEACHDTEMLFDVQEELTLSWVGGQGAGGKKACIIAGGTTEK